MYKKTKAGKTSLRVTNTYEGERIEEKINRIVNNKEPISDGAPIIFTERTQGVLAEYNPKTDRFEIAIDAMDKVDKAHKAKREERHKLKKVEEEPKKDNKNDNNKNSGAEPIPGTGTKGAT